MALVAPILKSAVQTLRRLRSGRISRRTAARLRIFLIVAVACLLEVFVHVRSNAIPRPSHDLDAPFATKCQDPVRNAAANPRENATFVMLTRNDELHPALKAIENIERQFNQWFHYHVLFINNEAWDPEFVLALKAAVSGEATFEVLSEDEWTFPSWTNVKDAREKIKEQGDRGIYKGGKESYHHMCRFYSG
jgi:mannosyltransferase